MGFGSALEVLGLEGLVYGRKRYRGIILMGLDR
jgi:hypothetical protein